MFPFRPIFGPAAESEQEIPGFDVKPEQDVPGFNVKPEQVPGFRVPPAAGLDPNVQPVRDPLRCSGPNSQCAEWYTKKYRSPGTFRDLDNPPFRLCPLCFGKAFGRPGNGDDTRLLPIGPAPQNTLG
jgi:hypothetical protein